MLEPIKRSDVELLHKVADGTPPPPKPKRVLIEPPGKVQQSQVHVLKERAATFTRVKPGDVVPIPKPERPPVAPPRELTEAEKKEFEEAWKNYTSFSMSATNTYATPVGLLLGPWCLWMGRRIEHKVRKKRFERRNAYGVEIFESYDAMRKLQSRERRQESAGGFLFCFGGFVLFVAILNFAQLNAL